ncbi:hypothetical protein [Leeia sp.]|uniref:hypothetical protein n=1 Tax=Leeia sp. TaxID=2884678 RepID=UPI0035ADAD62
MTLPSLLRPTLLIVLGLASLQSMAASSPAMVELRPSQEDLGWMEVHTWGGGARYEFEINRKAQPLPAGLAGSQPQLFVGCSQQGQGGAWQFYVGLSDPGAWMQKDLKALRAFEATRKQLFGTAGNVILVGPQGQSKWIPIKPADFGLKATPLDAATLQALQQAVQIQVYTPTLRMHIPASDLNKLLTSLKLPCR